MKKRAPYVISMVLAAYLAVLGLVWASSNVMAKTDEGVVANL